MGMYAIPNHDRTGYNGQTGASATWDPAKNMWIDTNGVNIRDDAITTTPGGSKPSGGPATTPTAAPKAAPTPVAPKVY